MPRPMVDALRRHRQAQRKARVYADSEWHESGLLFTTVTGRPIDPSDHSVHWARFLAGASAGVRPSAGVAAWPRADGHQGSRR